MKKSILAIAVAATMAAPAAMAAPTVYGNVHLSINAADNDVDNAQNELEMSSNTSAIGVKGSEDLGDGMKAIYKVEFQIDLLGSPDTTPDSEAVNVGTVLNPEVGIDGGAPNEGTGTLKGRDQFMGLKAGWGTLKFGTMSSNYKQMGGKMDPLYRTPLEGRGFLKTQSVLHKGRGVSAGRQTNTIQYTSPKMGGVSLVANTTMSGSTDETNGIGIRWSNKAITVYADWIDGQPDPTGSVTLAEAQAIDPSITSADFSDATKTESAVKVGGKFATKAFALALQYEDSEDRTGANYIFASGLWNINKNNGLILTYGVQEVKVASGVSSQDTSGLAVAYNHKMSKMTNVYVGYGAKSSDVDKKDESMLTAGMRVKF